MMVSPWTSTGHQDMGRSRGGLTSKIHAVVDTNGLPVHLALTPGEAQDRLCSVLLSALLPQTMLLADRGCDADWIRELARQQGAWAKHSTETKSQRPDLLQPLSVSRAQPDRTVLQQDQTMSACRDPIRQTRSQMFGVRQTRVNPDLATRY